MPAEGLGGEICGYGYHVVSIRHWSTVAFTWVGVEVVFTGCNATGIGAGVIGVRGDSEVVEAEEKIHTKEWQRAVADECEVGDAGRGL